MIDRLAAGLPRFVAVCIGLALVGLTPMIQAAPESKAPATARAVPPNIRVTDFKVSYPSAGKMKLELSATTDGDMKIGSFVVFVGDVLTGHTLPALPGMHAAYDRLYVVSTDFGTAHQGHLLKDNGQIDEDPRPNVFAITLDASKWPEGRYYVTISAVNAPNPGGYFVASRIASIDAGQPKLENMDENVPGAKHTVLWRKEDVYACFPSLRQLKDGRLVTGFSRNMRATHIDSTGGGSMQMVSNDGGHTWQPTTEHLADPAPKTSDGRLVSAAAVGWVHIPIAEKPRLIKERRFTMDSRPGFVAYLSPEAYSRTSTDGGKTWEKKPIEVPNDILGMLTFSGLETASGVRLVSVYGTRDRGADTKPSSEVFFLRSEDQGRSWQFIYNTPDGLKDAAREFNETTLHKLPNGELLAMHRTTDNLFQSFSKDEGKTWSYPQDTGMWGHPPSLVNLPDGRVLCVYGYRRAPMGIRACVSNDNGRTWDVEHELRLRTDGLAAGVGDLGYPKVTLLPDGELFTIYYIATDGTMPYIAGTHFRVPAKP